MLRVPAGTGKTFVLDAARQAWQSSRRQVLGCSLSARAALELHDQTAICAVTIAQLTGRLDNGQQLARNSVLVVDEAGMVATRDLARLATAAKQARSKLVLVGDDRQLPEIAAGGAFRALAERLPACELREVRRQRHAWDRQALDQLRSGEVERWARAYRDHGQITVGHNAQATRAALVNDWARADGDRLMIAARRDDVAELNQRARQLLQDQGRLGPDELTVAGRAFTTGDRVVGARNDRRAGLLNRTFVLGGEELYREWGYTALSRHKHEARFYVAGSDLHADREQPPPHDPLVAGLTRLLQRSQAKELALQSLPLDQREQLEHERRDLRRQLAGAPPPLRLPDVEHREVAQQARGLRDTCDGECAIRAQIEQLRRRDRARRAELERLPERNLAEQRHRSTRLRRTIDTVEAARGGEHEWVENHGPDAERLLAVDSELRSRDVIAVQVVRRLELHEQGPIPTDLGLERDLGPELGL